MPRNDLGITVVINEHSVPLFYGRRGSQVDLDRKEWQLVDIPLESFNLDVITRIGFWGRMQGTFYLDDIRLVAVAEPTRLPVATAVLEEHPTALPQGYSLEQNYPNPFNSETVIRFEMREKQEVELAVYNLGRAEAGASHRGVARAWSPYRTLEWSG